MHTEQYKGYTIELEYDIVPDCTASELAEEGIHFYAALRRHKIGSENFNSIESLESHALAECGVDRADDTPFNWHMNRNGICRPVYARIHGSISLSLTPFSCPFDSGQAGVIFMNAETLQDVYNGNRREALKALESAIEEINTYISGEIYRYTITDSNGDFVSSLGGIREESYALSEARGEIDNIILRG